MRPARLAPALAAACAVAAGCSAHVAPASSAAFRPERAEQGMWRAATDAEERIGAARVRLDDPALDAYLLEVARRLEPPDALAAVPPRVHVLRDRTPNAFCLPNGAVYLNSGLLAMMESEAELAVLLGHELTHAVNRHAFRQLRGSERTGALISTLGAMVGVSGPTVLHVAAVAGYSRDLEREADRVGLERAAAAGYDVAAGVTVLERLRDWSAEHGERERGGYYASHPRLEERIASCRELLAARPGDGGVRNDGAFRERTAPAVLAHARLALGAGDLATARRSSERLLAVRPDDAATHLLLGDLRRHEAAPGWAAAAAAAYRRAAALDPRLAPAWSGLGLALRGAGDEAGARAAFTSYLAVAPDAPDRGHVRAYLDETGGSKP